MAKKQTLFFSPVIRVLQLAHSRSTHPLICTHSIFSNMYKIFPDLMESGGIMFTNWNSCLLQPPPSRNFALSYPKSACKRMFTVVHTSEIIRTWWNEILCRYKGVSYKPRIIMQRGINWYHRTSDVIKEVSYKPRIIMQRGIDWYRRTSDVIKEVSYKQRNIRQRGINRYHRISDVIDGVSHKPMSL